VSAVSACEEKLPAVFLAFAGLFAAAGAWWAQVLASRRDHVHRIHQLMLVLVAFKAAALLLDSIRYHYLASVGSAEGLISDVFYVVTFLKSLLLFTVILLIGTGWSLVKPFLNDREKQVILVVLVLQVGAWQRARPRVRVQ
jgi:hypothetical protein